eukprot:gene6564-8720_t
MTRQPRFREDLIQKVYPGKLSKPSKAWLLVHMKLGRLKQAGKESGLLGGQMLLAMPGMRDERFQRRVIYMCGHSREGAMGIVINDHKPSMTFRDLLV